MLTFSLIRDLIVLLLVVAFAAKAKATQPIDLRATDVHNLCVVFPKGVSASSIKDLKPMSQDASTGKWIFKGQLAGILDGAIMIDVQLQPAPASREPEELNRWLRTKGVRIIIPNDSIGEIFFLPIP